MDNLRHVLPHVTLALHCNRHLMVAAFIFDRCSQFCLPFRFQSHPLSLLSLRLFLSFFFLVLPFPPKTMCMLWIASVTEDQPCFPSHTYQMLNTPWATRTCGISFSLKIRMKKSMCYKRGLFWEKHPWADKASRIM